MSDRTRALFARVSPEAWLYLNELANRSARSMAYEVDRIVLEARASDPDKGKRDSAAIAPLALRKATLSQ